jgi:ribosomal protein S8
MAVSDPVADFLTCVRNAIQARQRKVDVPASKLKHEIAKALLRERYLNNIKLIEDSRQGLLRLYLKYTADDVNVITGSGASAPRAGACTSRRRRSPGFWAGWAPASCPPPKG